MMLWVGVIVSLCALLGESWGHGRLMQPPSRSSMWRGGHGTPRNYDDNALNCGGFQRQWEQNGGKCGICGDPYDGRRQNEAGGKYAKGIIVKTYRQGDVMTARVQITAFHKGYFEFRICPNNDVTLPATQACLDRNLLQLADGSGSRYRIGHRPMSWYSVRLRLPADVTCTQCVFQWKYNAGNSWGVDPDTGRGCVGCGRQEQFYGCSDVAVTPRSGTFPPTSSSRRPMVTTRPTRPLPVSTTPRSARTTPAAGACRATGIWKTVPGMNRWCRNNCSRGYCPPSHCTCAN